MIIYLQPLKSMGTFHALHLVHFPLSMSLCFAAQGHVLTNEIASCITLGDCKGD